MTLSQWLDKWLDTYMTGTVRESTLDGYRRDLNNHVKPYLGEKPLLKITPADLSELYQALLERGRVVRKKASGFGLSPTTVHGIHTTLHHALRTAAEEGLLPANPADGATPPKVVNRAKGILNNAQLDTFKAAIQKDWIWRDFFLTELTTGLRRGELCGLKWSDFDEEAGTLKVCRNPDNSASVQYSPASEGAKKVCPDRVDLPRSSLPGAAGQPGQRIPEVKKFTG